MSALSAATQPQGEAELMRGSFGATVGQICDLFSLTPRAVRLYEEHGLVRPWRDPLNRRRFGMDDRGRFELIVLLRKAGVSIADIRVVLEEVGEPRASSRAAHLLRLRAAELDAEREAVLEALGRLEPRPATQ